MFKSHYRRLYLYTITPLIFTSCAILGLDLDESYSSKKGPMLQQQPSQVKYGMSKGSVRSAWGDPYRVQIAGEERRGNERWIYADGGASWDMAPARVVYFEGGRVIGWETLYLTQLR